MKLIVNIVLFFLSLAILYIAIHYWIIDMRNKKTLEQIEEEKDDTKKQLYEINKRITKIEKGINDEKRDNIRKEKKSSRTIR